MKGGKEGEKEGRRGRNKPPTSHASSFLLSEKPGPPFSERHIMNPSSSKGEGAVDGGGSHFES